jgi:membrane associated rhomboid family serine protease
MLGLYSFGADLERVWGGRRFLIYYFTCAVTAGATQLVFSAVTGSMYPTVGASGAVFGLLLAFAMFFPDRRVLLLFPPIPMRAPIFAVVYGVIELFLGVTGTQEGVAHFAHLGGMLGGFVLIRLWGRSRG